MKSFLYLMAWQLLALQNALADAAPADSNHQGVTPFIPLILIFGIFYFLILRPQQRKQKSQDQFLSEMKRGDMVVTNSGIVGTVKTLSDKFVTLEVDEGVCLKVLRSYIAENANTLKEEGKSKSLLATQEEKK